MGECIPNLLAFLTGTELRVYSPYALPALRFP
jgi:hypothetical protein